VYVFAWAQCLSGDGEAGRRGVCNIHVKSGDAYEDILNEREFAQIPG
jgi:hypothetical protein